MFTDKRYASGTSLQKTRKEQMIDNLADALSVEFTDDLHDGLKILRIDHLHVLITHIFALRVDKE